MVLSGPLEYESKDEQRGFVTGPVLRGGPHNCTVSQSSCWLQILLSHGELDQTCQGNNVMDPKGSPLIGMFQSQMGGSFFGWRKFLQPKGTSS